jgi:hypothetical protein
MHINTAQSGLANVSYIIGFQASADNLQAPATVARQVSGWQVSSSQVDHLRT